jgi:hypothetical protein
LKAFLARCKSSINGSFQQLGFIALRSKAKARDCVLIVLPALHNQQTIARQWTARFVSEDAEVCFLSSTPHIGLPEILPEDLYDERKPAVVTFPRPPPLYAPGVSSFGVRAPLKPTLLDADLMSLELFGEAVDPPRETAMKPSWSMSTFRPFEALFDDTETERTNAMKKSGSVQVQSFGRTWNLFEDEEEDDGE